MLKSNLNHFNSLGNEYLTILEDANKAHLTARAKYESLTVLLNSKGVKFLDIKNFLLNQAKKSGLYRKDYYDPKKGVFTYKPLGRVSHLGWAVAITNYSKWLKANYSEYNKAQVAKPKAKAKDKVVVRKNAKGEVVGTTVSSPEGDTSTKGIKEVMEELSSAQVMAILQDNWSVLGQYCQENGATEEFNKLMLKLG